MPTGFYNHIRSKKDKPSRTRIYVRILRLLHLLPGESMNKKDDVAIDYKVTKKEAQSLNKELDQLTTDPVGYVAGTDQDDASHEPFAEEKENIKDVLKKQYAPIDTTHKPVYTPDLTIEEKQELLEKYDVIGIDDKGKEHVNAPSLGNLIFHGMDLHFLTLIDNEDVYRYNGECYINDGQQIANGLTEYFLAERSTIKTKKEVYGHVRDKAFFQRDIFNPPLNLINFKNGILDFETGILYPHTHKQYFLTSIPHNYNPDAKCPNNSKFIKEVAYPSDISTLQEFIGYCFLEVYQYIRHVCSLDQVEMVKVHCYRY